MKRIEYNDYVGEWGGSGNELDKNLLERKVLGYEGIEMWEDECGDYVMVEDGRVFMIEWMELVES